MNRLDCLKIISNLLGDIPIIFTTGYTCREAHFCKDKDSNFYMVGSMGLASSIAFGLASFTKKKVVVVDGDGSLLMNFSGVFLSRILDDTSNLMHIVLDNGTCDSTGGQKTNSEIFNFFELAKSIGYKKSDLIETVDDLSLILNNFIKSSGVGPHFIHARIKSHGSTTSPRIELPLSYISKRFRNFIIKNLS